MGTALFRGVSSRWIVALAVSVFVAASMVLTSARQRGGDAVPLDGDDIGGVVTNGKAPEAGVWVIAETRDLPTGFRKIVVTDDRGRYVIPDLPKATYSVWVRGYGLVDSPKVQAAPGKALNLTAVVAPTPKAAAEYYPANYWLSLFQVPPKSDFPGTGPKGNGLTEGMRSQEHFVGLFTTNGCVTCHQMGSKITRELPKNMGTFDSSHDAWDRRVESGQSGSYMSNQASQFGRRRLLLMLADWTDRIAKGEVPQAPPRPQGLERNLVVTQWDWGTPQEFVHDVISSDERNPTVNANGPVYGATEFSADALLVLDPARNAVSYLKMPVLDEKNPPPPQWARDTLQPSAFWGEELIWNSRTVPHSFAMDKKARVWVTSLMRSPAQQPEWCKAGSSHPSARKVPLNNSNRQLSVYDPATKVFTPIDLCFSTHHTAFAYDADQTLWFNAGSTPGWFNTRIWDETKDTQKAQGWTPFILDTNANGKQDAYVEAKEPVDPTKDKRIQGGGYEASPSPVDGSIWFAGSSTPGALFRLVPGSNPPDTSLAEVYDTPAGAHTMRGGPEIDMNGVVWVGMGSGHMASFDRRKCKVLNGPTATGAHCAEGWTLYPEPGPRFKGTDNGTDAHYVTWVDRFDTGGLGKNVPIALGSNSDSLVAMQPDGKFVILRVPYPMMFMPKNVEGRIDDAKAGWKGRGLWSEYAGEPMWHIEGGKGQPSKAVKFQIRPNPLAK